MDCDKVGTSNYYWSFPSTALVQRKRRIDELEESVEKSEQECKRLAKEEDSLHVGREDSEGRDEALSKLSSLREKMSCLREEEKKYADFDPERLALIGAPSF